MINLEKFVDWLNGDEKGAVKDNGDEKGAVKDKKKKEEVAHEMVIDTYKLRIELMKKNITQQQLAEMCGLSLATISNTVRGRSCGKKAVFKISQALGVKLKDLMEE